MNRITKLIRKCFAIPEEPEYKVSLAPHIGGYVVHTDTRHIEHFNTRQEACRLRDKLNKEKGKK